MSIKHQHLSDSSICALLSAPKLALQCFFLDSHFGAAAHEPLGGLLVLSWAYTGAFPSGALLDQDFAPHQPQDASPDTTLAPALSSTCLRDIPLFGIALLPVSLTVVHQQTPTRPPHPHQHTDRLLIRPRAPQIAPHHVDQGLTHFEGLPPFHFQDEGEAVSPEPPTHGIAIGNETANVTEIVMLDLLSYAGRMIVLIAQTGVAEIEISLLPTEV